MRRIPVLIAAFLGIGAVPASGVELNGLTLGSHVFGPKIEKEDLAGRVVVYEFWGRG